MTSEQETKIWQTHSVCDSYEDASELKLKLIEENELVKIKRCGRDGSRFKLKIWNKPEKLSNNKKGKKK